MSRAKFFALAALLVIAPTPRSKEGDLTKAMWVVRSSIASPEQVTRIIEIAKNHGYTALVVQVRGRGDAFYKSSFEPRAEDLAGQPEDFDPLRMILDEGKKAGIEIHAWLNTHFTWGSSSKPTSPEHIMSKHPDWLMRSRDGEVPMTAADRIEGAYTCPSNPEVKEHIANCFLEVAGKYDVAGVHFDFVRYPNKDYCYCDGCLARFREHILGKAARGAPTMSREDGIALTFLYSREWDDWRRRQITNLVSHIYARAKALKPNLVVSAAVFPGWDDAFNNRFQDWKRWMREGCLDLLCPMAYSTETGTVASQIEDAVAGSNGRPVWAGLGAWRMSPEETAEKIEAVRALGAQGYVLFSYGAVTDEGAAETFLDALDSLCLRNR